MRDTPLRPDLQWHTPMAGYAAPTPRLYVLTAGSQWAPALVRVARRDDGWLVMVASGASGTAPTLDLAKKWGARWAMAQTGRRPPPHVAG